MIKNVGFLLFLILIIYIAHAFFSPFPERKVPEGFRPKFGTSFSFEQAGWYGQDPHKSFEKLLADYKFDWVRVPFFWDQMTDSSGNLKIDDLKFAAEVAEAHKTKLIIVLGAKTPYFPEYHLPKHIADKLNFGQTISLDSAIASDVLQIDKNVVNALSGYKAIYAWQVENEPFLTNVNAWKIGSDLLAAEIKTVRESDPKKRPIILNSAGSSVFGSNIDPLINLLGPGDILGVNAYFKTQGTYLVSKKVFGKQINVPWPDILAWPVQSWVFLSPDFSEIKNKAEKKNLDFWILEAQAEPYVRNLDYAKNGKFSFNSKDISKAVGYLSSYRVDSIGLWGANFWQYRESVGDKSWTEEVKKIIN